MKKLFAPFKKWWDGTYNPPPAGSLYFHLGNDLHWTAEIAHRICKFYLDHWKWVWSTALGCATFYLGLLRLNGCY